MRHANEERMASPARTILRGLFAAASVLGLMAAWATCQALNQIVRPVWDAHARQVAVYLAMPFVAAVASLIVWLGASAVLWICLDR